MNKNLFIFSKIVFPVLLILMGSSAYAMDGDFYTYEGFSLVVNTFRVIALIFHDHQFKVLVGLFATIGIFSSGFISFMRAVFNNGQNVQSAIGWLFWPIFGCIIYQGLVLPKGTIHIYDRIFNQYQAVRHVPSLLVALSTVFNNIEEGLRKIISTNTASPYAKDINNVSLKLFYDTMMHTSDGVSIHYEKSIRRFYDDCMPISNAIEPKFDLNRLLKDTPNIFDELQHLWHPSIFTIFYGENRRGTTLCCTDAWNKLSTWINNPGNFQDSYTYVCKKHGFFDSKQLPACKKEIGKGASFLFGRPVNSDMLVRNALFAQNIAKLLTDRNPDRQVGAYSTRKLINSGLASATVSKIWIPGARAVVTSALLAIMPFLLMMLVTPLLPKVIALIFSLFAWLTIWGV